MIRQVRKTDYEALARFFADNNRPQITRYFHPFPFTPGTACQIARKSHLDRYYVEVWGEDIIGLCMLQGWDEGFEIPSFGVFVDYRYHGIGLGRKMTEFAIKEARKLGSSELRLSVYASNETALSLYNSLGFKELARESVVVMGEPDEKIVMLKSV